MTSKQEKRKINIVQAESAELKEAWIIELRRFFLAVEDRKMPQNIAAACALFHMLDLAAGIASQGATRDEFIELCGCAFDHYFEKLNP